jgi:hypothetical protein
LNIKHLAQGQRSAKYSNSTFQGWAILFDTFNEHLLAFVCIIITLSVVKLAIETGHAMQVFNDLHYSNRYRLIGVA